MLLRNLIHQKKLRFKTYAELPYSWGRYWMNSDPLIGSRDPYGKRLQNWKRHTTIWKKGLNRPPNDKEVAKALGISIEKFHKLLDKTKNVTFLDIETIRRRMPDNNEDDLFDLIADDSEINPFALLNKNRDQRNFNKKP